MSRDNINSAEEGFGEALEYWNKKAKNGSTDCERVEQSKRTQLMRYEAFLQAHDLTDRSILDVGCGTADLRKYLQARGVVCRYSGFDISPEMIKHCQERFPGINFYDGNFLDWQVDETFDYTIAIGIHNVKIKNGWNIFKEVTKRQFELSSIAAHISILTDRYHEFAPHIQSWKAEDVLSMALEITPYVVLRHDYLPNDFSITLYREPLIDTIDLDFQKYSE